MRIGKIARNRNWMHLKKFFSLNRMSGEDSTSHVKKGRITEMDGNIILGLLILSIVLFMIGICRKLLSVFLKGIFDSTGNLS